MTDLLRRFYSTERMVKPARRIGEITPTGEAYRTSAGIAIPAVAEMVSIALMGMVSTAMVGRLGPYAIAAVGLTGQPRMTFICVFYALNIAVTAVVSRRKGENDQRAARSCMRQSLMMAAALGALMTFLAVRLAGPIMALAGANEETLGPSTEYFIIVSAGMTMQALSMVICAAQRGVGNTKVTMYVNMTANVINVTFNFLLIEGNLGFPRLGVRGAGFAILLSNVVGLSLAVRSITDKNSYLYVSLFSGWRMDAKMIKTLTALGGNSMIEKLALRVGFFIYARIVADLGTKAFAAHQIGMQMLNLSFTFADGIAVATTALVGENLGRERPDLSMMYGQVGQRLAFTVAMALCVFSMLSRGWFPRLFTGDAEIVALCGGIFTILAVSQPVQTSQVVMAGSLRGAGDARFVAFTMLLTVTIIRPVVSYVLGYAFGFGLIGIWTAILVDQVVRLTLLYRRFTSGSWTRIKV